MKLDTSTTFRHVSKATPQAERLMNLIILSPTFKYFNFPTE